MRQRVDEMEWDKEICGADVIVDGSYEVDQMREDNIMQLSTSLCIES